MSSTTTDLNEIKEWAEAWDGKPGQGKNVGKGKGREFSDRFPGYSGEDTLEEDRFHLKDENSGPLRPTRKRTADVIVDNEDRQV